MITLRIYLIVALLFAAINLPSNMRKHEGKKDFVEILLSQLFVAFMWPIVLLITAAGYLVQAFVNYPRLKPRACNSRNWLL